MTASFPTYGEAFAERELRKERRAGVEHYVVGQHHAEAIEPDDPREAEGDVAAVLTYCSPLGLVGVPMVKPEGGDWEPLVQFCRLLGLGVDYGTKPLPEDWVLTDEMREALDQAVAGG